MTNEPKNDMVPSAVGEETVEEAGEKNLGGLDDASKFLAGREDITWTEEEEKVVLRKIDRWLLPLVRCLPCAGQACRHS
jgi:hypothetical protein